MKSTRTWRWYPRGTLAERFWSKVDKRGPDECWPWTGCRTHRGYGQMLGTVKKKYVPATHVALELAGRPVPAGMFACHRCDNPPCCNERHLFHGTHDDNMADMVRKGRSPKMVGETNSFVRLGEADVRCIRRSVKNGIMHKDLARLFGVHKTTISKIMCGMSWRYLPAEPIWLSLHELGEAR